MFCKFFAASAACVLSLTSVFGYFGTDFSEYVREQEIPWTSGYVFRKDVRTGTTLIPRSPFDEREGDQPIEESLFHLRDIIYTTTDKDGEGTVWADKLTPTQLQNLSPEELNYVGCELVINGPVETCLGGAQS
ncbi:hypothetical protein AGMMS49949_01310 [Alphaproteobacteria bacterium]|nr:hypothetical protein AGMMS49949_01310 [Alphaproteobacteria bacterium]GHS95668.1 hypothetical protein AGMMS50296_0520 [Alphaproteobacteria bacterium]